MTNRGALRVAMIAFTGFGACTNETNPDREPTFDRGSCDQYLACVHAVTPEAYASALASYGDGSICWTSEANATQCASACSASLVRLGDACHCEGSTCEPVDTVFTLAAGAYAATKVEIYPDNMSSDGCNLIGRVRTAQWSLQQPVDDANPVMQLYSPDARIFGLEMTGRIIQMQGMIDWAQSGESWAGNVIVTADDAFAMSLAIRFPNAECRSNLLVEFVRQ